MTDLDAIWHRGQVDQTTFELANLKLGQSTLDPSATIAPIVAKRAEEIRRFKNAVSSSRRGNSPFIRSQRRLASAVAQSVTHPAHAVISMTAVWGVLSAFVHT